MGKDKAIVKRTSDMELAAMRRITSLSNRHEAHHERTARRITAVISDLAPEAAKRVEDWVAARFPGLSTKP